MATDVQTEPGLKDPDEIYEALIRLHDGLDAEHSGLVNARLILILANHIGDQDVVEKAIAMSRGEL